MNSDLDLIKEFMNNGINKQEALKLIEKRRVIVEHGRFLDSNAYYIVDQILLAEEENWPRNWGYKKYKWLE